MRRLFHVLLILSIGSVHAFGAHATVEIRHSHSIAEGHLHGHAPIQAGEGKHHHGHDHGHDHDHHGHDHAPANEPTDPCDSHGGDSNCPTQEHSHTKTLGGDAPLMIAEFAKASSLRLASIGKPILCRDSCPEGPYYTLAKPPQLA